MATYIKFNNSETLYPAIIGGRMSDKDWDGRASKFIHVEMSLEDAMSMFADEVEWSIVMDVERQKDIITEKLKEVLNEETGEINEEVIEETITKTVVEKETYDNSDYSILGDITVHKDGTVTVKMGKPTAEEILNIILGGE